MGYLNGQQRKTEKEEKAKDFLKIFLDLCDKEPKADR